jgi:hypothetical protein
VVATSETYESKESCLKGIAAVKRLAAEASVIEADASPSANGAHGRPQRPKTAANQ